MTMLNDITLGQYYPIDSFIHRLDPRTKILVVLSVMSIFILTHSIIKLTFAFICLTIIITVSHIPFSLVVRNLRPFFWLFLLTIGFQLFFTNDNSSRLTIPFISIQISQPALINGILYSFRLAIMIISAALLTLTTSPMELTDALDHLLKPLQKLGISTHEFTMMITLSLRFIPTLIEEADKLQKAQISRGATFEGNIIQRVKSVIPLILPLFISVFRRADELALAMDARCYTGGKGRTSFKELVFTRSDYLVWLVTVLFIFFFIFIRLQA